jgi:hypothetical protein
MSPFMKRATTFVAGAVVAIGLVVILTLGDDPVTTDLSVSEAGPLYQECMDSVKLKVFSMKAPGNHPKHPNLELWVHNRNIKTDFADLFTRRTLIGLIKNIDQNANATSVGRDWEYAPAGYSCVFMGGEKTGLHARVVWMVGTTPGGQLREVSARWHANPHLADSAQWDNSIDAMVAQHTSEGDNSMKKDMPGATGVSTGTSSETQEASFVTIGRKFGLFSNRTNGTGPWYTCSEYTCCKPL